jgi:hypothetical protein
VGQGWTRGGRERPPFGVHGHVNSSQIWAGFGSFRTPWPSVLGMGPRAGPPVRPIRARGRGSGRPVGDPLRLDPYIHKPQQRVTVDESPPSGRAVHAAGGAGQQRSTRAHVMLQSPHARQGLAPRSMAGGHAVQRLAKSLGRSCMHRPLTHTCMHASAAARSRRRHAGDHDDDGPRRSACLHACVSLPVQEECPRRHAPGSDPALLHLKQLLLMFSQKKKKKNYSSCSTTIIPAIYSSDRPSRSPRTHAVS